MVLHKEPTGVPPLGCRVRIKDGSVALFTHIHTPQVYAYEETSPDQHKAVVIECLEFQLVKAFPWR